MVIDMDDEQLRTLADLQGFLDGTVMMDFTVVEGERYAFIVRAVKGFDYGCNERIWTARKRALVTDGLRCIAAVQAFGTEIKFRHNG